MTQFDERLQGAIAELHERILTDPVGVLDVEGVEHHEFVSGNHGRKLDFDKIDTYNDFFIHWVGVYARAVRALYSHRLPDALVGIANGANRLSEIVAPLLGKHVLGLTTIKLDEKTVALNEEALEAIARNNIRFALTIEDVGTTGGTTATAITHLRAAGVRRIESINGWQRNPTLPRLDELRIPYNAVILDPLPMYSPENCLTNPLGYCALGVPLIPHVR